MKAEGTRMSPLNHGSGGIRSLARSECEVPRGIRNRSSLSHARPWNAAA